MKLRPHPIRKNPARVHRLLTQNRISYTHRPLSPICSWLILLYNILLHRFFIGYWILKRDLISIMVPFFLSYTHAYSLYRGISAV